MMGIIVIALSVATAGFFLLVLWGIVGFRGNHMYYQNYVHGDMLSL